MQRQVSSSVHPSAVLGTTLMVTILSFVGLLLFSGSPAFDTWSAMILLPVLVAVTLPFLARQANREGTPGLFWLLAVALLLKLIGSLVRYHAVYDVYEGGGDAVDYAEWGETLSAGFWSGNFETGLDGLTGTNFVRLLTGMIFTVIGPSAIGGFLVYSWLGFIGLFLFYRGFTMAVPEGRSRTYARLLFFLPSLLFWPSSIGKEAWMMFALGMASFGAARLFTGRMARGIVVMAVGLWLAALIRPHIAVLFAMAAVGAFVLQRRPEARPGAKLGRAVVLAGLVAGSVFMAAQAEDFLVDAGLDTDQGVSSTLTQATERSAKGGSRFAPSVLGSPAQAPGAVVTVLYRPFVTEVDSAQSALAALEGTVLLLITLIRLPWLLAALRSVRRQPYVAYALANTSFLVLALSSFANFGILARQRVQLWPMFLVLLAVPSVVRARRERTETVDA